MFLLGAPYTFGLLAAADPLNGEWIADANRPAHSVGLRTQTLRIAMDGAKLSLTESGTRPGGDRYSLKFSADCDGKVYGIAGNAEIESLQCWHDDPRKLVLKLLKGADALEWRTLEVAKNGLYLRITTAVSDDKGKEEKTAAQFTKK